LTHFQLESRKNTIEIELKERLHRRRDELKTRIEALEEPDDEDSSVNDLETKTKELRTLHLSIQTLTKKLSGV